MRDKQIVFETEWFSVEAERFHDVPSLGGKPYYRINAPDGVIVLALTEDERLILVRQFRPALNRTTLEFPCGAVDPNEDPIDAAARELFEETGYRCTKIRALGPGQVVSSRNNSREFGFLATGAVCDAQVPAVEAGEIEVVLATRDEFRTMVQRGEFEQLVALALLVLADWKVGTSFVS